MSPPVTNEMGNVLAKELLFVEGKEHGVQRELLLAAFSHSHVKGVVPKF